MQSDTVAKSRSTRRSSRPRTEYAFDVNTNETRCECQKKQAHRKTRRESHSLTARNILTEKKLKDKSSRKQSYVGWNHEEGQGCELRGKENLEWNTDLMDLIETMKLKNVICQETEGVYSDEDQHESREADVHEDLIERNEETHTMAGLCQRRPSSRGARMCSKTRERDMNNHDHDYGHAAKQTATKGWHFVTDAILPLASEGTHGAPVPLRRKAVGGPTSTRPRTRCAKRQKRTRARHATDTTCTLTW